MVRGNTGTSSRAKSTLPLTRKFVPPRRLGVVTPKEDIPTSSLTPVEDYDDDEDEESEEKEVEIKQDKGKGKMIDTDIPKTVKPSGHPTTISQADEEASTSEYKSSNVLKTVQELMEEYTLRQKQLETFMSEATSSIAKLEERIVSAQSRNEDDEKCRESLRDLKALMADTLKQSTVPIVGIESAGSFGDFNNQQARTQSHLSRFTQLDSDEDSTLSLRTIDPKVLRPSYQGIGPAPSPTSSPDPPSSSVMPSSPPRKQAESSASPPSPPSPDHSGNAEDTPASDPDTDTIDIPPHSSPLFIPSPPSSPYHPSSSAAAAASSLMSIAHSDYQASSPPPASVTHEATRPSPSPPSPQLPPPLPTQPTLSTEDIHHLADEAVKTIGSKKRSRRQTTTPPPAPVCSSPMQPPPKRLKSRKTGPQVPSKPKIKKRQVKGESGSLPIGTLAKGKGVTRVKGANWPKLGPNTVIGLAGNIECEHVSRLNGIKADDSVLGLYTDLVLA